MASRRHTITPVRITSVETAIQYLAQAQVDANARFDRLEAKVDRVLFTIIAVGAAIFAAVIASNWIG